MLLSSLDEIAQDEEPAMSHCAGMVMPAEPAGEGSDSAAGDDATVVRLNQSFNSMQHCQYLCQLGRSMTSFDASDSLVVLSLLLVRDGDFYASRFVSPPLEVHFRPPINA